MTKKSSVLTVRVPDSLLAALTSIAAEYRISLSLLVCSVLTSFVDEYTARNK